MKIALTSAMTYIEGVHDKCTTICVVIIGITAVNSGQEKNKSRVKVWILGARAHLIDRATGKVNFSMTVGGEKRSFRALLRPEEIAMLVRRDTDKLPVSHVIMSPDMIENDRCPIGFAIMICHPNDTGPFEEAVFFARVPQKFADLDWSEVPQYIIYDEPKFDHTLSIEQMQRISQHGIMLPDNFAALSEDDAVLARLIA